MEYDPIIIICVSNNSKNEEEKKHLPMVNVTNSFPYHHMLTHLILSYHMLTLLMTHAHLTSTTCLPLCIPPYVYHADTMQIPHAL